MPRSKQDVKRSLQSQILMKNWLLLKIHTVYTQHAIHERTAEQHMTMPFDSYETTALAAVFLGFG